MKSFISQEAASIVREQKSSRRHAAVFVCLAVIVALATMLGLRMYGHAMTKTVRVFECTVAPHTHTEACYVTVDGQKILNCGEADFLVHMHNLDCYNDNGELVCSLPEVKPHTHTADCWQVTETLTCTLPEAPAHTHTEACYGSVRDLVCGQEEVAPHTHTDACYTATTTLTCGLEEHIHTDACYSADPVLTCAEPEHTHSEACRDEAGNIVCGLNEHTHGEGCYTAEPALTCTLPEHTHGPECYTTEQVLTCTVPETAGHTHTDACYALLTEPICGMTEGAGHTHTDACYTEQKTLICPEREAILHTHTEECWTPVDQLNQMTEDQLAAIGLTPDDLPTLRTTLASDGVTPIALTCGQLQLLEHMHTEEAGCFRTERIDVADEAPAPEAETETGTVCGLTEHTHTDACYDETGALICGLEEHTHTEACWPAAPEDETAGTETADGTVATGETAESTATAETAGTDATPETAGTETADGTDGQTFCGLQEHTHTDACYTFNKLYTCGQDGDPNHTHNDTCTYYEKVLSCKLPEHTHTEDCYVDPAAGPDLSGYDFVQVCDLPDGSMRVTAAYNKDAQLPENAMLIASMVPYDEGAALIDQARELLSERDVTVDENYAPVVLNIGFYVDGAEVEPAAPVFVTVQMLNADRLPEGKPISVVHFPDNAAPEVMQGTDLTGGATSFTSDSFSPFGLLLGFGKPVALNTVLIAGETDGTTQIGTNLADSIVESTLKDKDGNVLGPNDQIVLGEKYSYYVKFSESADKQFTNPLYFQLPKGFQASVVKDQPVIRDNQVIGTYSIDENGLVEFNINDDYLTGYTDVWIDTTFNLTAVGTADGSGVEFPWEGGEKQTFQLGGETEVQLNKKAGSYDPLDHTIDYTVTLDVTKGSVFDAVITDTMENGVSVLLGADGLPEGYTITVTDTNGNPIDLDPAPTLVKVDANDKTGEPGGWRIEGLPSPLAKGQQVNIEYKAVVAFDENGAKVDLGAGETRFHFKVSNTAEVTGTPAGGKPEDLKGTKTVTENKTIDDKFLEKDGSVAAGNTIDWEIQVGSGAYDVRGKTLKDTIEGTGQWVDTSKPLEIKWKDAKDDTINKMTVDWILKDDGTVDVDAMKKQGIITNIVQDAEGHVTSFDITIPDENDPFWKGIPGDETRTWKTGDWVKLEYFTSFIPPEDGKTIPYTNKVTGLTDSLPEGVDGNIVVGTGGIEKKFVADVYDGKDDYVEYKLTVRVPNKTELQTLRGEMDELPYFYIQDKLEFPSGATYDANGNRSETTYCVENLPDIVSVEGVTASGQEITFKRLEKPEYEQPDLSYTYTVMYPVVPDDSVPLKDIREFRIWFNTNLKEQGKRKDTYRDSVWPIDEDVTLTITYRIPGSARLTKKIDSGNYVETDLTMRDLLETGNRLRNEVWGQFSHSSERKFATEAFYTKSHNEPSINKQAHLISDNEIEYNVRYDNAYTYTDSNGEKKDANIHLFTEAEVSSFTFYDDFDDRLEYVPGSLEVVVLDVDGSVRGIFKADDGEIEAESGSGYLRANATAFNDRSYEKVTPDKNGGDDYYSLQETESLADWLMNYQRLKADSNHEPKDANYLFRYRLRVRSSALTGTELTLENTAHVQYGSTNLEDNAVVTTTPVVLNKSSDQLKTEEGKLTNEVKYTIVVNDGAANLAFGTSDDGQSLDLGRYTLTDIMSDGMIPDWNSIVIEYEGMRNGKKVSGKLTRVYDQSEVTLDKMNYTVDPSDVGNGMVFLVPDELKLTITYNLLLDTKEYGSEFHGVNTVSLSGGATLSDQDDAVFKVEVDKAQTGASDSIRLYKFDADTKTMIDGATFTLYTASAEGSHDVTVKDGNSETYTLNKGEIYKPTKTADSTGRQGASIPKGTDKDVYYVLIESEAPPGYAPEATPVVFRYGKDPDTPETVTVTVDGKSYDVTVKYVTNGETITVYNTSIAYELPETGGSGAILYTLSGLMLLLGAALVYRTFAGRRREHV